MCVCHDSTDMIVSSRLALYLILFHGVTILEVCRHQRHGPIICTIFLNRVSLNCSKIPFYTSDQGSSIKPKYLVFNILYLSVARKRNNFSILFT